MTVSCAAERKSGGESCRQCSNPLGAAGVPCRRFEGPRFSANRLLPSSLSCTRRCCNNWQAEIPQRLVNHPMNCCCSHGTCSKIPERRIEPQTLDIDCQTLNLEQWRFSLSTVLTSMSNAQCLKFIVQCPLFHVSMQEFGPRYSV